MTTPFGIGFGDIALAIKLCKEIREKLFNPVNNAQIKYLDFKEDIVSLNNRLNEFKSAFDNAFIHINDLNSSLLDTNRPHITLKHEADELIGDFVSTLIECRTLLEAHVKFDRKRGTILDTVFWYSSTQGKVDDLRRRIQLHTEKIRLFLEPIKLRLTSDILADTSDILELLGKHFGLVKEVKLPAIPSRLDKEFREALHRDAPVRIPDSAQIPLKEGIDALTLHYRQSAGQFTGSENSRKVEQYLNLLKAHWLVEILLKSTALENTRPGHLYRRIIKQVEQLIAKQYGREISRYSEEALCALDKSAFAIWPEKIVMPEQPLTEPMEYEEKLAELSLVPRTLNETGKLFVFLKSDRNLRIVHSRTPVDQTRGPKETERFFNLRCDGLVPWYAITAPCTEWNMEVIYGDGAESVLYSFQEKDDALKLQQAFTGYETAPPPRKGILCCHIQTSRHA